MTEASPPAMAEPSRHTTTIQRFAWPIARMLLFAVFAIGLAYENPIRLRRSIPGNPADAYLIMSLLEWGSNRSVDLFRGYWEGPMFASGENVMAYTDTFLPLVVPFGLLELITGSRVLAFNLLYLAGWVLCAEASYRLLLRFVPVRSAATVGALAFTFSTIRVSQSAHFQLAWAGLIPLGILLFFRLKDKPSVGRGIVLGLVLVSLFLISAYYGLVMIVSIVALGAIVVAVDARRGAAKQHLPGFLAALVCIVGLMIPIRHWYATAQASAPPRSDVYPGTYALRLGDLRSPAPTSTFLRHLPFLDGDIVGRSSENYAFIGFFVIIFVPLFVYLVATRRTDGAWARRRGEWLAIAAIGLFGATIAVGRGPILGIRMPIYDVYARVIPGIDSIAALVRLFVFTQLGLVLAATAAFAYVLGRLPDRRWRVAVSLMTLGVIAFEGSMQHELLDVVHPSPGSVYEIAQELEPGVSVELPMAPIGLNDLYIYTEATRMVLGTDDRLRTLNGYSGYAPTGYGELIDLVNQFPETAALDELRRLDVRYVVLHTTPIDSGQDRLNPLLNATGFASYEPRVVDAMIASLPPGLVARRFDGHDGVLIELDWGA